MRILLTGASGQLGPYVHDRLLSAGHAVVAWSGGTARRPDGIEFVSVDLSDGGWDEDGALRYEGRLAEADPEVVVHLAAVSKADEVARDFARAERINAGSTAALAEWCAGRGRRFVLASTDLVFDGSRPWWREGDTPAPVLGYGRTKEFAEIVAAGAWRSAPGGPGFLIARLSLLFGFARNGRPGYFDRTVRGLCRGEPQTLFEDEYRTPLDYATAAEVLARLAESGATGVVHVGGTERVSRHELIRRAAVAFGLDPSLVVANRRADAGSPESRPADVSLDTSRLAALLPDLRRPTIREALAEFGFEGCDGRP